jgi:hypothetical protein
MPIRKPVCSVQIRGTGRRAEQKVSLHGEVVAVVVAVVVEEEEEEEDGAGEKRKQTSRRRARLRVCTGWLARSYTWPGPRSRTKARRRRRPRSPRLRGAVEEKEKGDEERFRGPRQLPARG